MKLKAKIIKVGQYHMPSKFTAPDGRVFDVPAFWDALVQFDDGDIASLKMRGIDSQSKVLVGMQAEIDVASIVKQNGVWNIKGETILSK